MREEERDLEGGWEGREKRVGEEEGRELGGEMGGREL